jgi:hypothetical protein
MANPQSRLGRVDELGRLFVFTAVAPADLPYLNGFRLGQIGPVRYVNSDAPTKFQNGVGMIGDAICIALGSVIHHYLNGLPRTLAGAIVGQINNVTTVNDTFVNKMRLGPLGGLYIIDITPPVLNAFSSGFSNGFGL